jgi:hypothetical protein
LTLPFPFPILFLIQIQKEVFVPFHLLAGRERYKPNRFDGMDQISAGSGFKLPRIFQSLRKLPVNPVYPI